MVNFPFFAGKRGVGRGKVPENPARNISDASLGTEELGHLEMIGAIVHQLTRNLKENQIRDPAFAPYFVDRTAGVYPAAATGTPWSAETMAVKGDPMTDLVEDLAADGTTVQEQRG